MRNQAYDDEEDTFDSSWEDETGYDDLGYEEEGYEFDEDRSLFSRIMGERPLDRCALVLAVFAVTAVFANALWFQPGQHPAPIFAVARPVDPVVTGTVRPEKPLPDMGAKTQLLRELQREMIKRGIYEGAADGRLTGEVELALRNAETLMGMKETGQPADALLQRLRGLDQQKKTLAAAPRHEESIATLLDGGVKKTPAVVERPAADRSAAEKPIAGKAVPEKTAAAKDVVSRSVVKQPSTGVTQRPVAAKETLRDTTQSLPASRAPSPQPQVSPRLIAVQNGLVAAGYGPLKVTGQMNDETRRAISRFEQINHLPVTGQMSVRLETMVRGR